MSKQRSGYMIVKKSAVLIREYIAWRKSQGSEVIELLQRLHSTLHFLNPTNYRGVSRQPLACWYDPIEEWARGEGRDVDTNRGARQKMTELLGVDYRDPEDDFNEDALFTLEQAMDVFKLLDTHADYEIIHVSRNSYTQSQQTLGYDVGYWTGDHFSIICDSIVMPVWHSPDPEDFLELAEKSGRLNKHILFNSPDDAKAFKDWYATKSWAETESIAGEDFQIIQVDEVIA